MANRSFFIHSRDIMLVVDSKDGKIIEANPAAESAYGYLRDELLSKYIFDLRVESEAGLTIEQMRLAITESILFETIHRRKDGSLFPVEVSSRCESNGKNSLLFSVIRDITERQRDKETLEMLNTELEARVIERTKELQDSNAILRRTEKRLAIEASLKEKRIKLLEGKEATKLGYYEWNVIEDELYWSDQMYLILGLAPQEIMPSIETLFTFIHPEDKEMARKNVTAAGTENISTIEYRIIRKDDSIRWLYVRRYSILDDDGTLLKRIGTIQDITEEKHMEKAEETKTFANEIYNRSVYLNDLLMTDYPVSYITQQLNEYGIDCNMVYCCYILQWNRDSDYKENITVNEMVIERIVVWFFEQTIGWVWKYNEHIVFLAPVIKNNIHTKEDQIQFIRVLLWKIKHKFSIEAQSGISSTSYNSLNIKELYEQARRSLIVATTMTQKQVLHYEDLGVYDIAFQLLKDTSQCRSIQKIIGKLADYDEVNAGNLLVTLEQILEDGNLKISAQKLFIHYNTAIWRKQRIEKILSLSLDHIETKCMLILYLKVWKLLNLNIVIK
ncbi:PAS domain S-box protein [Pelosinus sp. sgz500959]|uniref:PAS domain S-box protein n=1 Tax=Pelosinus sp. sgz500959 TaxID=3242472 RepID=UPI00366BE4B3